MLKKLKFKDPYNYHQEYSEDIQRIVKVFYDRDCEISEEHAVLAWEAFSDSFAAGWLTLRGFTDDEIFSECFKYFEEVNEET